MSLRREVPAHARAGFDEGRDPGQEEEFSKVLKRMVPIFLPEDHPIPDSQEFNVTGSKSTSAVEAGIPIVIAPQVGPNAGFVELPAGNIGRISSVLFSITDMLTTTDVTFTLRINGAPVPGYAGYKITPRVSPYVSNSFDDPSCRILLRNGDKINVVYTNTDGGTYVVGCAITGWFWPEASGKRWLALGY